MIAIIGSLRKKKKKKKKKKKNRHIIMVIKIKVLIGDNENHKIIILFKGYVKGSLYGNC